jgi:hypothetical protein
MRRSVRVSWLLVVVIGLAGVASMSLAGSAGASNKGWCKDGGWTGFRDDTGGVFKNQGQCVSYVAQGGKLFVPTALTVSGPSQSPTGGSPAEFSVTLTTPTNPSIGDNYTRTAPVDLADGQTGATWCTALVTNGKGSCFVTFPSAGGTYTLTAAFAGDTKNDPGLLPGSAKATVVVLPCTDGC